MLHVLVNKVAYWQVDHIKDWTVGIKWSHTARVWSMSIKSNTSLLQCHHSSQKQHFTKVKNQSSVIWFFKGEKKKSKISGHMVSNGLRLMYVLIVVSPLQIQTSPGLSLTLCLWVYFPSFSNDLWRMVRITAPKS